MFHLAQSSRYREFPDGVEDMRRVNIDATAQLLEWSRKHGVKRFIFASSGNVYKSSTNPLTENDPTEPVSFYGTTKLCAEHLVAQYRQFFSVVNARLFGVYGPGQKTMIIPDMIQKILCGEEITLAQGKGIMSTPLYISDCIEILAKLWSFGLNDANTNPAFNIAGKDTVSLGDIVAKLEKAIGVKANIRLTDENPKYFVADIHKLNKLFAGLSFTNIDDGLNKIIAGTNFNR